MEKTKGSPLLVIGLDGATFDLVRPMAERGELPTLARVLKQGASAALRGTVPPVSSQAWSSFLTGTGPGKHGIFGALGPARGKFYGRPVLTSRDVKRATFLSIAGEAGKRILAFGTPMTYPPYPINGVLIPEQHEQPLSYPEKMWGQLVAAAGDHRDSASHIPYLFTNDKLGYLEHQLRLLAQQAKALHWLLDQEQFDLTMAVFTASSRVAQYLWKYMDREHPDFSSEYSVGLADAIFSVYRRLDEIVGSLWGRLGSDTTLMIMSDHGSGPLHKKVYLNRWLLEKKLLRVHALPHRLASSRMPWSLVRLLHATARRSGLPHRPLPDGPWAEPIDPTLFDPRLYIDPHLLIDWPRTKAYSGNSTEQGVFVNLKTREPFGSVVHRSEYNELRTVIRHELLSLEDPEDRTPIVKKVWFREELYEGPWFETAPDLIIETEPHYALSREILNRDIVAPSLHSSGTRRQEGVFLLVGPAVRTNVRLDPVEIIDLAPTLLHLLGLPVPASMDGDVVSEAFLPDWLTEHPIRRSSFTGSLNAGTPAELTEEETARMEAHLRSLGYIG
jgi:predicted AlkP superfamily phosphohydrolase/phosphomutase